MGLVVNSDKCELYPCGDVSNENISNIKDLLPGIKVLDKDSLALLGAPIFPDAVPDCLHASPRPRKLAAAAGPCRAYPLSQLPLRP